MTRTKSPHSTAGALQSHKDLIPAERNSSFSIFSLFEKLGSILPWVMLIPLFFIMALGMIVLMPVMFAVNPTHVFEWFKDSYRSRRSFFTLEELVVLAAIAITALRCVNHTGSTSVSGSGEGTTGSRLAGIEL